MPGDFLYEHPYTHTYSSSYIKLKVSSAKEANKAKMKMVKEKAKNIGVKKSGEKRREN